MKKYRKITPTGVDFEYAEKMGIKVIMASGLPGKYFPVTAGKLLYDCISDILEKRGFVL